MIAFYDIRSHLKFVWIVVMMIATENRSDLKNTKT